jgi:hypothetical protein
LAIACNVLDAAYSRTGIVEGDHDLGTVSKDQRGLTLSVLGRGISRGIIDENIGGR